MALGEARPYSAWMPQVLYTRADIDSWEEELESDLIWDEIRSYSDVRKNGIKLFPGTASERREKWSALNDYARQARAYYDALEVTAGSARGLLGYYSLLNLAKAELLHSHPSLVVNRRIGHGLSFDVARESTIRGDFVKVTNGVFTLLYEARTGVKLPNGTKLPIRQLVARIPEIGREYATAFNARSVVDAAWYRTVSDGNNNAWPVILTYASADHIRRLHRYPDIRRSFEFTRRPTWWRGIFPELNTRSVPPTFMQGRQVLTPNGQTVPHRKCTQLALDAFGSSLEASTDGRGDFLITAGLYKTKDIPMPTHLARYALMFYLSSLVRYRPSRLNPAREQLTVWLLEAYARQSPPLLLAGGLEGIIQKNVIFGA